ncbi:pentatricopeptide repeat-containing protein At4g18840-like [Rhodamnia argentea]|uniref:Pentatricopeptide repeat-containing protein At4g18840-like n=1 Tax=Rhodamnia argentea TaxID=178133 RepID=A0A8B8PFB4_9MYRT|nr:pentatricopeptide repeat-containing protein At4g18840-like [Rhodamnia argentea]
MSSPRRAKHFVTLTHPLLRKLDSCCNVVEFNQVHAQLIVSDLSDHYPAIIRAVKKLCALRAVAYAVLFFKSTKAPDASMCNTIMRTYVGGKDASSAVRFYRDEMVGNDVMPNHYTFPIVLKGCVEIGSLTEGEKVHGRVFKLGLEPDLFVTNALIHLYSAFQKTWNARLVFDAGSFLDCVSWNTMIDGYVKNGEVDSARELFDEMTERDPVSWTSMIGGYIGRGEMEEARCLFDKMPSRDTPSWNCMINGYARIGCFWVALELFNSMPSRNVTSWNTLLDHLVRHEHYGECLSLFDTMLQDRDIKPNKFTLLPVLTACGNLGDIDRGQLVHSYITRTDFKADVALSTALLTMYAKCGAVDVARNLFDQMPDRNVVSWNAMILGYGMHGHGEKALDMFLEMEKRGQIPDGLSFVSILSACKRCGMVLEGWWCFDIMSRVYAIDPKVQHYGCILELLAMVGLTKEDIEELEKEVPTGAGSTHSTTELGEIVAERLIELNPTDVGPYVLLANVHAAEGNWDSVENVRKIMKETGLQKEVGSSLFRPGDIESGGSKKDSLPHRRVMIYSMLSEIGSHMKVYRRDSRVVEELTLCLVELIRKEKQEYK